MSDFGAASVSKIWDEEAFTYWTLDTTKLFSLDHFGGDNKNIDFTLCYSANKKIVFFFFNIISLRQHKFPQL